MSKSTLPSPDERPNADVVIYDGNCRFCSNQVQRLSLLDHDERLSFLSLHDNQTTQKYADFSHDDLMEQMHVVNRTGNVYRGARAFRYLTRRLPSLWLLSPLLHVPFSLPMWQWCYRHFAKRRYRFGQMGQCDSDSCSMHLQK